MAEGREPRTYIVLALLPFLVMALVAGVDLLAGPEVGFLPLVSLGPAFAGLVGTWRRTVVVGALAMVLCGGLGLYDDLLMTRRGYTALASVAGVTVAGVVAAIMRGRREEELASVRSIAEVAQRVLLRPVPRSAGPLRVAVSYTSAVAEARIGGDLYEVAAGPDRIRLIVGDVQGKGLTAVETASVVLGTFREAAYEEPDLAALGARLERSVARELEDERFVTAIVAEVRPKERTVVFLNHGHPPPMLVRRDGTVDFPRPDTYALPLGLAAHGGEPPGLFSAGFVPGDQLLLYTDGVTEARNGAGDFYPLKDKGWLLRSGDAQAALDTLRQDVDRYTGGVQDDDAAMLLVRYRPGRGPGRD
ncbi:serine/threonine-protein phosphatase [Streptomyces sp. A73]|uniref:PP2C family protein-serine/threonine phosphatase n=1 Tax=Streptomyces TaxID=1883 RepID=UPI001B360C61|nr:PP2C family protein-serine/threonine phosphatase [Streptomyces sp. B15]MBQ1119378.1 serine/threonine-protein phosphatase [Streptomyces sp. B15]MBQ1156797.1 serine/threonine-protein phosphatase [Streptomyces sp. A73]